MHRKTLVAFALAANVALVFPVAMGDGGVHVEEIAERYLPRAPGTEVPMTFFFGPFLIPAGQDFNRVTVDLPLHGGFFTSIAPDLVDAATGGEPYHLNVHIHHAHWFRVSDDPTDEYYTLNLAWIFGTGEEETQGSINARSDADPLGPRYGIHVPGGQPQALIFMLHNKVNTPFLVYVVLKVNFVYGDAAQIAAANGCGPIDPAAGEACWAGRDFHALKGRLWGSTFDVPRDTVGDGIFVHPQDLSPPPAQAALGTFFKAPSSGTVIATAGHMHPNGLEVVLANLGPEPAANQPDACAADLDGDGWPGVTLLRSRKLDRFPEASPLSEEYQMAVTKHSFRAPVREGDRISQFGVYKNDDHPSYGAMSYVGIYVDREQVPAPYGPGGCTVQAMAPVLIDPLEQGPVTEGVLNHAWHEEPLPHCGFGAWPACDQPEQPKPPGLEVPTVQIAGFAYIPGDFALSGALGAPVRVPEGQPLAFVNEDASMGIRHSVTSCAWPCNGPYVANHPNPDGAFHSGELGNFDYINGGLTGADTVPVWLAPSDLAPGKYAYYCRIHPDMRGAFEVVAQA